jgi:hypothetical protein
LALKVTRPPDSGTVAVTLTGIEARSSTVMMAEVVPTKPRASVAVAVTVKAPVRL